MKETAHNMFVRSSSYVEVAALRRDSYLVFASKAARILKIVSKELKILKLNGAQIVNQRIDVGGSLKEWTIGSYLSILAKKSPAQIKIGVAAVDTNKLPSQELSVHVSLSPVSRTYIAMSHNNNYTIPNFLPEA